MGQLVDQSGKVKRLRVAVAKASLNRAPKLLCSDPKPSDLAKSRLKNIVMFGGPNSYLLQ